MQKTKYKVYVIVAAALFGISPTIVSLSYSFGGNTATTAFFVSIITLPIYYAVIRTNGLSLKIGREQLILTLFLGVVTSITNLLLWTSYNYLSAGMSTILHFMYPAVITLILLTVFRQRLNEKKLAALLLSIGGVVLISWGGFGGSMKGIVCALLSSVTWAVYIIMLDKSPIGKKSVFVTGFYVYLCQAVISLVYALFSNTLQVPYSLGWVFITMEAVIGILSYALLQKGTNKIGSFSAGIFATFEPLVAFAVSYIVFSDDLTMFQVVGTAAVLLGVVLDVVGSRNKDEVAGAPVNASTYKV